jgi:hypothetical protein
MNNNNNKISLGGKVLASGGFGCVFSPALKCKGEKKRQSGRISKLMTEKYAIEEYEEINSIREKLSSIKHFENYFLLYNTRLCRPEKITKSDLVDYTKKCSALPKNNITKTNINDNLDKLLILSMPNGGPTVDNYLYNDGSFEKMYKLNISLINLLKKGIIPMNKKNVYHCDIKNSNVLVDTSTEKMKTRLIDWGLSTEYNPFKNESFPRTWRNRPLQFNVPFSVIIFTDAFYEMYTKYIQDGGIIDEVHLKPFVIDYIRFWMKERGAGHYKYINEIMYILFSNGLTSTSTESKSKIIETQITMNYIINYIVDVLVHYTKLRKNGSLNLRLYLDDIFVQIVDIWGFISVYLPIVEILFNNYSNLDETELKIFNKLKHIFVYYLYDPRHEAIDMYMLYSELNDLGKLFFTVSSNSRKNISEGLDKNIKKQNLVNDIVNKKTKKNILKQRKNISFKKRPKQRRFRNPFLLSLK